MIHLFIPIAAFFFGLTWGSFLNTIAWRFLLEHPLFAYRSACPACHTAIAWYDLVPIFSWLLLRGQCRWCQAAISLLYPLGELLTGIVFVLLASDIFVPALTLPTRILLGLFSSSLIITITTDLVALVISRVATLGLIPVAIIASWYNLLNISATESIAAACAGYLLLWAINAFYTLIRKERGIGEGDMELLALVGSFLGFIGVWFVVMCGSLLCTVYAVTRILVSSQPAWRTKIPFGPWLSLAGLIALFIDVPTLVHYCIN